MNLLRHLRHLLAATLLDAPRYGWVLRFPRLAGKLGRSWVDLCNRGERLVRSGEQRGVLCAWEFSTPLFFCKARPGVGQQLLRHCLGQWPIRFAAERAEEAEPDVSFVIGHRGLTRMPHLLTVLDAIAAQRDVTLECIVVEQSPQPELAGRLPGWVRWVHTPVPEDLPYARAWAFNCGAKHARGRILVFHDNDICPPVDYARELVRVFAQGFQAARLQRLVFYLTEQHTREVFEQKDVAASFPPEPVVQNSAGGTLAVEREAYFAVGQHDEAFLGWGGEDNEIFDRLRTLHLHDHAYVPLVHLHHAPQPGKAAVNPNTDYYYERMALPAEQRIRELRPRAFGSEQGPLVERRVP